MMAAKTKNDRRKHVALKADLYERLRREAQRQGRTLKRVTETVVSVGLDKVEADESAVPAA